MAKISDKERLDFLERLHIEANPFDWVGVLYDGTLVLDEPKEIDKQYDLVSNARPTFRQAIDAAIRAESKK